LQRDVAGRELHDAFTRTVAAGVVAQGHVARLDRIEHALAAAQRQVHFIARLVADLHVRRQHEKERHFTQPRRRRHALPRHGEPQAERDREREQLQSPIGEQEIVQPAPPHLDGISFNITKSHKSRC
jgi:hypothetical protein